MPYKDAEKQRQYQANRYRSEEYKRKNRDRWATSGVPKLRPFIGVDGEGGKINGKHEYLLLRVGEHLLYRHSKPLRSVDILRWLCGLPNDGIHVGFAFDYDVSMILRDLPPDVLLKLYDRESRKSRNGHTFYPVLYAGFLIEHLPRKHFRVARLPVKGEDPKWFTVHDTFGFYQSSFVQALEAWNIGTPEEREHLREMKAQRADFTEATKEEIAYNHRECILLAELLEALRDATRDVGYVIKNYEGAGCLAQAMLTKHKAPARQDLPEDFERAARSAYYGGRFEISRIGVVAPVHEYDLASAYPWAMSTLPCIQHGVWVNEFQPGNPMQVCKVSWATSPNRAWGPYPFRDPDGTILYPAAGTGWYWYPEIVEEDRWKESNVILDAWSFVSYCDHKPPFSWIPSVYAERQRLGKSAKGKVLKLGMNSLYGKQAQSVGLPRFSSPVYAGYITSLVRAVMANVCYRHREDVVMIATDGIYLTRPLKKQNTRPVVENGEPAPLGCWEHQAFDDLFLMKPGIYFTSDGAKVKTRGVPRWQLDEKREEIIDAWNRDGIAGKVTIERTQFIGARMAIRQNRPERIGQWEPTTLTLNYGSNLDKRDFDSDGRSVLWTRSTESTPYRKTFGQNIADELLWEDLDGLDV